MDLEYLSRSEVGVWVPCHYTEWERYLKTTLDNKEFIWDLRIMDDDDDLPETL